MDTGEQANGAREDRETVVARALADSAAGLTRRELADAAGMSLPTLDRALKAIRSHHAIEESQPGGLRFGRRAGLVLGVDVGRAHRRACLADLHGNLIGQAAEPNRDDAPEQFTPSLLRRLAELIEEAIAVGNQTSRNGGGAPYDLAEVRAITVGVPYPVNPNGMTVGMFAPDLSGLQLSGSLRSLLAKRAREKGGDIHPRLRVWFARDADLGARQVWREHLQKHPPGSRNAILARRDSLLYLKASHGLDAGMICHGVAVTGAHGLAGQMGHVWLPHPGRHDGRALFEFDSKRDTPPHHCPRCGRLLCVENVASGQAVVDLLARHSSEDSPPATVAKLVQMLNSEQAEREDARATLKRAAEITGVVLADVVRLADPSRIVVGGLLALTGDTFMTPLRIAFSNAGLSGLGPKIEAVPPTDVTRIELRGAVALALKLVRFPWQREEKPEPAPVHAGA